MQRKTDSDRSSLKPVHGLFIIIIKSYIMNIKKEEKNRETEEQLRFYLVFFFHADC